MAELADRNERYARTAVSAPEVTVTVAGAVRKAESVSISAEGGGGLPDQVSSVGTGILARTGSITWSSDEAVDRGFGNPAAALRPGGWPPAQGDPVTVDVTVGGKTWRRFTGRIGKTKGGIGTGSLVSEIADDIEARLTNPVTIPATSSYDAEATFYAAEALRLAGIGPLPTDPPPGTILYHQAASGISLVGEAWSEADDGRGTPPVSVMRGSRAEVADTGSTSTGLLLFAEMCDPRPGPNRSAITLASGASIRFALGENEVDGRISVTVSTSRGAVGTVSVTMGRDGITDLCAHISAGGATIQVWDGAKFVNVSVPAAVRVPVTEKVTGFTPSRDFSMTGAMLIRTNGTGTVMAEAQARPRHRISRPYLSTSPGNAVGNPNTDGFRFTRSIVSAASRSILDEFCQAGLYSQWIDEYGRYVLRHVTSPVLEQRYPGLPPRALDEMVDASWTIDSTEVASRVLVQHQVGHLRSVAASNTVTTDDQPRTYGAEEFESGATSLSVETWYSVPETEEWGPLSLPVLSLTSSSVSRDLNAAYSYTAAQVRTETETTWADEAATPVTVTSVPERVGPRSVKVTDTITKPAADAEVILTFPENAVIFYKTGLIRGGPAPILRARWITDWVDVEKAGSFTGPDWAPIYVHEAGALVPPPQAQWVADYLSYWLSEPRLVFDQIDMLWSPSRSIGDSEEWGWTDSGADLPTTRALIVGISEEYQAGEAPTQTVTARLLTDVTREARDYQDLADQYPRYADIPGSRTYQDVYSALPERPS